MEHRTELTDAGVALVTLNRPERLNALTVEGFGALAAEFKDLHGNPAVKAIVLTATGRGFCAGADLDSLASHFGTDPDGGIAPERMRVVFDTSVNALLRAMKDCAKPIVCAVNGIASGGGAGLALAGDVVLAARSAAFHLPFAPRLGIVPDAGASWLVSRALGRNRALPMMLTGETISADTALDWGMVWRLEPDDELLASALDLAATLARSPTEVLPWLRRAVEAATTQSFHEHLDFERDANSHLCATPDFVEGVTAFREKRPPVFGAFRPADEGQRTLPSHPIRS